MSPTIPAPLARALSAAGQAVARLRSALASASAEAAPTTPAPAPARGVGIDVEDVERWRQPRRLADHFSSDEMARAAAAADPTPHFAGWWAAREATVKALAGEGITVRQVRVTHDDEGRPSIAIPGRDDLAAQLDLSISHSDSTAVAVVVRR